MMKKLSDAVWEYMQKGKWRAVADDDRLTFLSSERGFSMVVKLNVYPEHVDLILKLIMEHASRDEVFLYSLTESRYLNWYWEMRKKYEDEQADRILSVLERKEKL